MNISGSATGKKLHPQGVIVPLLTPVTKEETICFPQVQPLVDHVLDGGVDGLFVLGTSGEAGRFPMEERGQLVAAVVKAARGRAPVYAGVSDCGTRMALEHVQRAADAGADAVVSTVPYYFPTRSDGEAVSYFTALADRSPVPLVLYNIPATVGVELRPAVIQRLCGHPNIVGVKDSGGDPALLTALQARFQKADFSVLMGDERLLYNALRNGADGCVPSMANCFPKLLSALYRASLAQEWDKLQNLCGMVDRFNRINSFCDGWMSPNIWRKAALALMGVMDETFTSPSDPMTDLARVQVAAAVEEYRQWSIGV